MGAQRHSAHRERIYEAVAASRIHPSAEMIYQQLKPYLPQLSLGTVYRNLQQLSEEGRLRRLCVSGADRFDAAMEPHTHFCCSCCGQVLDLPLSYDSSLDQAAEKLGCQVTGHSLMFFGICPRCSGHNLEM